MNNDKNKLFFEKFIKFKTEQNNQKKRGVNDFNPLTVVHKYHNEVYLHSAMIGALLDPNGKHYQDSLFLEIFLRICNIDLNLDNTKVLIEYYDIDLFITDGNKHIIIENKIRANDQPCQIIRYINIIKEKHNLETIETSDSDLAIIKNLYVLYLTPQDKDIPKEHKLIDEYICFDDTYKKLQKCPKNKYIEKQVQNGLENYLVKYKKITYKKEIKEWLKKSLKEVENIISLREIFRQYLNVVSIVNQEYKGNLMSLFEYMEENEELFNIIGDIFKEQNTLLENIQTKFWDELYKCLNEQYGVYKTEDIPKKYPSSNEFGIKFQYSNKNIDILREENLFIAIYDKEKDTKKEWKYITHDGIKHNNEKEDDLINFQNGNANFWKLGKQKDRELLIENIIKYIQKQVN